MFYCTALTAVFLCASCTFCTISDDGDDDDESTTNDMCVINNNINNKNTAELPSRHSRLVYIQTCAC